MSDVQHVLTVEDLGDRWRRACTCGFQTTAWENRFHPVKDVVDPGDCPRDPTVRALTTLQFAWGGLLDSRPADGYAVHLVRRTNGGTPGPTLCGIDRFAKDSPGWSVGGGLSGPGIAHVACPGCIESARTKFADLPVTGFVGADVVRDALIGAVAG